MGSKNRIGGAERPENRSGDLMGLLLANLLLASPVCPAKLEIHCKDWQARMWIGGMGGGWSDGSRSGRIAASIGTQCSGTKESI